ncbi:MAG: DUF4190 domain-containing protein [Planctomycetes bacterium]|nr:DUF4190 domain-containing protein [Planctomycetota bacterium]
MGDFNDAPTQEQPLQPGGAVTAPTVQPGPKKTSGLAVGALILGILAFISGFMFIGGLLGLVGLILGIAAIPGIKKDERLSGKGLAIAGIVLSILGMLSALGTLVAGMFLMQHGGGLIQQGVGAAKMAQIKIAMDFYAENNAGRYPDRLSELVPDYIGDTDLFKLPGSDIEVTADNVDDTSAFVLVPGLSRDDPPRSVLIYGRGTFTVAGITMRSFLYLDGTGDAKPEPEFRKLIGQ